MKIVSPDILHKSDAGGVKVNIKDDHAVRDAYNTIMKNAKAYKADAAIYGIAMQEMAPLGTEVILGSINDSAFGQRSCLDWEEFSLKSYKMSLLPSLLYRRSGD